MRFANAEVGSLCASRFADGEVGRVGRGGRVGHLIFKRKMPESFAHERCLDHLMRNSLCKALCRCLAKFCAKLTGRRFAALEPSGAAGWSAKVLHGPPGMAKRHSVRMSRHEVWPEGQTRASESPLTGRIDERAMKGRDPKTPSRPSPCGAPRARVVPEP